MDSLTSKPSCIKDLKELVDNLTDRDVNIKQRLQCIKSILEDKGIKTDTIKIKKIKQIFKNG